MLWHKNRRNKLCEPRTPVHREADISKFPVTVGFVSVTRDYYICQLGLGAPTFSLLLETRAERSWGVTRTALWPILRG